MRFKYRAILLLTFLLSLPILVSSQGVERDILMLEQSFTIIDENTIRYSINTTANFRPSNPQEFFGFYISDLPFVLYLQDIDKVKCNDEILRWYSPEYNTSETEWQGYIIYHKPGAADILHINYDHQGLKTEYHCEIIITIKEATASSFISFEQGQYIFKVNLKTSNIKLENIDSIYLSVIVPKGHHIVAYTPEEGRNTSKSVEWRIVKPNLSQISKINVVYEEEKPIETPTKINGKYEIPYVTPFLLWLIGGIYNFYKQIIIVITAILFLALIYGIWDAREEDGIKNKIKHIKQGLSKNFKKIKEWY